MAATRTKKSIKNTLVGLAGLIVSLIVSFVTRSVFIDMLGQTYNGVNGLFANILQMLNMAELGFSSAIAYSLYKPLKDGDERATTGIMNFYAKVYRCIALIVAVAGALCIPFLQHLISEDLSELPFTLTQLRIYFSMYLANTVSSYLLAYKRTLIRADQQAYIISAVDYSSTIVLNLLQILLLYLTKNFYAYLAIMIAKTVLSNLILDIIARKKYPFLKTYRKEKILPEESKKIVDNVKALFLNRIGHVIMFSTQSIIISSLVGVNVNGVYTNYALIVNNVYLFVNLLFNSVMSSVGDLGVSESDEHKFEVFKKIEYLSNFIIIFATVCYICLFNDFILVWLKDSQYTFNLPIVILVSAHSVVSFLRMPIITFKEAFGLFRQDWYRPLIGSALCIGGSIGLGYVWGVFGILLAYVATILFVSFPIETAVLFKYGFHKSFLKQLLKTFLLLIIAATATAAFYALFMLLPGGIWGLIAEIAICFVGVPSLYVLCTFKTKNFAYYKELVKKLLKRSKKQEEPQTTEEVKENAPLQEVSESENENTETTEKD
ncbi:MAG: oligosaccharide flippase family protein [Muribaculaceae bacterium]|nr:oligosaccharide flippase family protein [Muribaculaceae bacterium]